MFIGHFTEQPWQDEETAARWKTGKALYRKLRAEGKA